MGMTIEQIVEMKKETNFLGVNAYEWFFADLENNHLSKQDGAKRNASIAEAYDKEAQAYIIHQLFYMNEDAARELMTELHIEKPFVTDEHNIHIVKN